MGYREELPRTRDVARETGRFSGWGLMIGFAIIIVIGLLSWFVWAVAVGTSDVRGKGDAIRAKNSGTNRVAAQERFEVLYQDVTQSDAKLDVLRDAAEAPDAGTVDKRNYTGQQTYCLSAIGAYDAEARKYSAQDFRAIDLPAAIDKLDPTTDCKPTPKENDK